MKNSAKIYIGLLVVTAVAAAAAIPFGVRYYQSKNLAREVAAGSSLYQQNCASCHGANLEGQPDWRAPGADGLYPAPPHNDDGHTWHHTDQLLFDYTSLGGAAALKKTGIEDFESGMPAFGEVLSADEIRSVLTFIRSNWSDRNRISQQERTKNAEEAGE